MTEPIAADLFEDGPQPRLIGGRDRETGAYVFPLPLGSEGGRFERVALADTGTLWTYTVQRFRPKSPPYAGAEDFEPYAVGYVELPGQLIVEGRLVGLPPEVWRTGMRVRTTTRPFALAGGETRVIYAFEPAGDSVQ